MKKRRGVSWALFWGSDLDLPLLEVNGSKVMVHQWVVISPTYKWGFCWGYNPLIRSPLILNATLSLNPSNATAFL